MKTKSLWSSSALRFALFISFSSIATVAVAEDRDGKQPPNAEIVRGALETYISFAKSASFGAVPSPPEIPKKLWSATIQSLKPIRVYTHRVNVVVVQRVTGEDEEGLYVYIPLSSYLPMDGADGFALAPKPNVGAIYELGSGVFKYHRKTTNKPAARERRDRVPVSGRASLARRR
jgi:hypothetical protein